MENEQSGKKPAKILIVDDISMNVEILANIVEAEGYEPLCAISVQEALDIMNKDMPQLILSDYSMPGMNGLEFCKLLKSNPRTREIPFIFITVADSSEEKKAAFSAGAVDFIPKPFERVEVVMRVNNHLNSYRIKKEMQDYNRMMHKMVAEQRKQMDKEREKLLLALTKIIAKRTPNMIHHLDRVGHNARMLAQSLQLVSKYENVITDSFVETIGVAARLHDIGNLVLVGASYDNETTEEERLEAIKNHTENGAEILADINEGEESGLLTMATTIAKYHHANWDGSGYPNVKEKQIPLEARITAIVNDFDALLLGYHKDRAYTVEESVDIMNSRSGTYYDPDILEIFNKVLKRMETD